MSDLTALAMEVLLTTGLVSTILGTASGARNIGSNGALAVGGYISLAGLWAAPDQRRLDEPGALICSRRHPWRYEHHLDLCRRSRAGAQSSPSGFEWILKGKPTAAGTLAARGDLTPT